MAKLLYGTGKLTYEVLMSFGQLPAGVQFSNTSHVAVDSKDRVYVTQRKDPPILVFDSQGRFLASWGEGLLEDAHGIYITPSDEVLVTDRDAHEVLKFSTEGKVLLRIGTRYKASFQTPFNHPVDVAVAPGGEIYVTDGFGNSRVHKFSPQGKHILSWGAPGTGPGQFSIPQGVWVDKRNRVYVVDRDNDRVQIFDQEGRFISEWRDLYRAMDIFIDGEGTAYVTDQTPRFTLLDGEGKVLTRGKIPDVGHGVWADSQGNIYLAGNIGGGVDPTRGVAKLVRQQQTGTARR